MAEVDISSAFIDYLDMIGCKPPRQISVVHHCAECHHRLNKYQAAMSKFCGTCIRRFKEFEDRDGISITKEG